MLDVFWLIVPFVLSLIAAFLYMSVVQPAKRSPLVCPPVEEPIAAIYEPRVSRNKSGELNGHYKVSFASTGPDVHFALSANDIVDRCTRHQQKIPYIVGADKAVTKEYNLNLGDDLLVIVNEV